MLLFKSIVPPIRPVSLPTVPDRLEVLKARHHFFPPQNRNGALILLEHAVKLQLEQRIVLQEVRKMLLTVSQVTSQLLVVLDEFPVYSVQLINFLLHERHLLLLFRSSLLYFSWIVKQIYLLLCLFMKTCHFTF